MKEPGVLIISLDFELHWGVFQFVSNKSPYLKNLQRTPQVIDFMLDIFKRREISATWATVGFLFAESSDMIKAFEPNIKPVYDNIGSNPYMLKIGRNEAEDPIHFAPSIIKKIRSVPKQEIATHTFSHFICRSKGATVDAFEADLDTAIRISAIYGIDLNCIVFPKNQLVKEYIDVLKEKGIKVFRGAEKGWMYPKISCKKDMGLSEIRKILNKCGRMMDTYIPLTGANTWRPEELMSGNDNTFNIPASRFVRPYNSRLKWLEPLKLWRIKMQIKHAAKNGEMVHLRWHPHNFGSDLEKNIKLLEEILDYFENCRSRYNMMSMTMYEYYSMLIGLSKP